MTLKEFLAMLKESEGRDELDRFRFNRASSDSDFRRF